MLAYIFIFIIIKLRSTKTVVALRLSSQLPLLAVVGLVSSQLQQDREERVDTQVGDFVVITHLPDNIINVIDKNVRS